MISLRGRDSRKYSIESLCRLFGKTKQAFYKHDENRLLRIRAKEDFAISFVQKVRLKDPGIGGKKLWLMYRKEFQGGALLGRDRFSDVLDQCGLKLRQRIRKPRTTDSTHGLPVFSNLAKDFIPTAVNQLWVSDITYITMWLDKEHYAFCYLSLVLDSYSKEIVGWAVGPTLAAEFTLAALDMALKRLDGVPAGSVHLIHHSDRGCQYASDRYVSRLRSRGIRISMTESGDPKDNAQAERINNTMKNELLKGVRFESIQEVTKAVEKAVKFYNEERPHMSVDMKTPRDAADNVGDIPKRWTSRREMHLKNQRDACNNPEICLPSELCQQG